MKTIFVVLAVIFLLNSCTYDSSISVKNSTKDTLVFYYTDQSVNDSTINDLSEIQKEYIVEINPKFRNEYVIYPFEHRTIIHHGKWRHYPLNDSLKLTFYIFKFDTIKKYEFDEIINKYIVFRREQFTTEELHKNDGIIKIK